MREREEHLASPCDIRVTWSQKCATNRRYQSYCDVEELLFVRGVLVTPMGKPPPLAVRLEKALPFRR